MGSLAYGHREVIDLIDLDFHEAFDPTWQERLLQAGKWDWKQIIQRGHNLKNIRLWISYQKSVQEKDLSPSGFCPGPSSLKNFLINKATPTPTRKIDEIFVEFMLMLFYKYKTCKPPYQ